MNKVISISVKPGAREDKIERITDLVYKIKTTALPEKGKANEAVIKLVAKELGVSKGQIEIKSGKTSRSKVLIIYG